MRILLATYWPYPHVGGVSTYLENLRSRLEEMGHEVELLAQHPNLSKFYLVKSGKGFDKVSLIREVESSVMNDFEQNQIKPTPWVLWREIEKCGLELACRQIDFDDYDLIHTQDIISTYVCRKVKPAHIPLVATIHGCLATEWIANNEIQARSRQEQNYLSMEEYYGAMSPDYLILPSYWLSSTLLHFQIKHPNSYVIPYGINQQEYQEILEKSQHHSTTLITCKKDKMIIACPARLVVIKGQTYLIEAMKLLVKVRKDVVCWIIGDGVQRNDLEKQIIKFGLEDHVLLLGKRDDVPQLLALADIVVLPSLQDNLPFSIIESQSLGKPVIASRIGGIVEMIEDGVNGLHVEPRNSSDLYEKLLLLVENEKLREQQSKEAWKHAVEVWSDTVMLEQTLQVYERAIAVSGAAFWDQDFSSRLMQSYQETTTRVNEEITLTMTTMLGKVVESNNSLPIPDVNLHLIDISGVVLRSIKSD